MSSKSVGGGIAALGVILTIVGVILYIYEERESVWGLYTITSNPYRDTGFSLLVLGIIIIVVGAIVTVIPSKPSSPQQASHDAPSRHTAPNQAESCSFCGSRINPTHAWCPWCGKEIHRK